ncbi:PREDICTED: cadherin-related family member 3 isoform X1 [Lepidothrix coronata]|uniref:Cadherin-related family member 3 isoform X1 n=1 Tax=Lepidothrix coronata TaxID=321398 RepID=A0A6J0GYT1_9PASS|nr:PREDICTED: cadherin-related family member 3 isoform X1 [Lepidothrix coronata]XP_017666992.1 PREDICTED: cadherin-related family member 3 isoform X1 [Lepidothrix coronata]
MKIILLFLILLGVVSGRKTPLLKGLPATSTVEENTAAGVSVCDFNVTVSPLSSEGVAILPTIVNSNPLTEAFDIESKGGLEYRVVTTGNPVLDYETMPKSFDLHIFVEDTTGRTDLSILTIRVTDKNEHPVFRGNMAIQTLMIYVLEGTRPQCIYQVDAADPENAKLKYSLLPTTVPFLITESGAIFSTKEFDYEKDPHCYFLNVTVTDLDGLNSTKTVNINIININDESPYFTTKQRIYRIPEEQSPGTIVANITAKDPDDEGSPSRLFYSIQSSDRYFSINPSTGVLQVTGRIDRDALPLQLHPNISLIVQVEDSPSNGHASNMEITIIIDDINDNPPECSPSAFRKEVNENTAPGTFVIDLRNYCKDIDVDPSNNQFNFTGLSGFGSNNFILDSTVSGRLVMTGTIDLENPANPGIEVYTLTVRVQDIAHPNYSNIIYIYIRIKPVNEFFPVFSTLSYVFNVSEITKVGSSIGRVHAIDKDWPPTIITYSIVAGGGTRDYTNIFWISPTKGDVRILARLDYETTQKHIFIVQASDQEKFTTASVTVNVLEVNDEEPVCSPNFYSFQIPVSLAVGTNINGFRIECQDRDSDPRSFRYFINEGNENNHFTFSPSAGSNTSRLILASRFDYESGFDTSWIYNLRIYITDDNLLSVRDKTTHLIETGTVTLSIRVIPNPTTAITTTPGFTVVTRRENLYSASAWYVPFVVTLGSLLLLGLLGFLGFLLVTWVRTCCPPAGKAHRTPLINAPEKKKPKKDVVVTMTKLNTIFDGEARDPVTGRMYEFNTRSGARRWKKSNEPLKPMLAGQVTSGATDNRGQGTDRAEAASKKEPSEKRKELTAATKPATKPSADQDGLRLQKQKEESEGRGLSSAAPQGGN